MPRDGSLTPADLIGKLDVLQCEAHGPVFRPPADRATRQAGQRAPQGSEGPGWPPRPGSRDGSSRANPTLCSRPGLAFEAIGRYACGPSLRPMKTVQEYRQQAEECRELAKRARSADERDAILAIAASWENLAAARMRKITKERPIPKAR